VITRIAPTPSGYLHLGNCVNIQLIALLAERVQARIALRIDDADADRYRREYLDDIFRVLDRLGVDWQIGPRTADDFEAGFSQRDRREYYRSQLDTLRLETYACTCSRSMIKAAGSRTCVGECRQRRLPLMAGRSALRVHVPAGTVVEVAGSDIDLAAAMGDFVLWRRDDLPAYQLVSTIEDRDLGTSLIVRGADLMDSTAAQVFLARGLGADSVERAVVVHHDLITDDEGGKLSKSQLDSGPLDLTDRRVAELRLRANDMAGRVVLP
jgi:glutamyl/glutaminyl-tRNA synthetase